MKDRFQCINTLNIKINHSLHRPTGKPIHTWNQMHFGKIMYKAKYSPMPARTIYPHVAGLCRRLGTWRPKTERLLHSKEQTNKRTFHLTWRSVCVRVEASGKSRSSCRLVHAGVLSKATGKILRLASYPKRPARSLFRHISHLTALSLRRVHVWMQVQHLQ